MRLGEHLLILRVVGGMFETVRLTPSDNFMFGRTLVQRFTNELVSGQHNEHYLRSMSMKTEILALRGQYDNALKICNELREVYSASNYSRLLSQTYGQDHCCQCIAQSAVWSLYLKREDEAAQTCDFVINTLLSSADHRKVGHYFILLYPVILVMKNLDRAREARDLFEEHVVKKSKAILGRQGKTPDMPTHKAIIMLLNLATTDCAVKEIKEIQAWALDEEAGCFSEELDFFTASIGRTAGSITAEICLRLSESEHVEPSQKSQLLKKGLDLANKSRELIGTAVSMSPALHELEPIYAKLQAMNACREFTC